MSFLNTSGVSLDLQNSWAAKSLQDALRQAQNNEHREYNYYQAKFQQRQMQEKEEKLLRLYENQQQRAFEKVSRGSSGGSSVSTSPVGAAPPGKVRQMFDERRQKAGIDRSYPLEPLKQARTNVQNQNRDRSSKNITRTTSNAKITNQRVVQTNRNLKTTIVKQQQRNDNYEQQQQLVDMMNNHNINDNLDEEQLPQFDDENRDLTPSPNENYHKEENISVPTTPVKNNVKVTPVKKTVVKTVSKNISPRNSPQDNKKTMKAATSSNRARGVLSAGTNDNLTPCKFCSRRFASDRLGKHEEICARTTRKKRKIYDAVKHRVQGTEVECYAKKGPKGTTSVKVTKAPQMPKTDWRRQHEEFISTIRAAKMAQAHVAAGGKLSDLPPPPPSLNPDYVQCPHCGRRFNEAAAARHIPKCATMLHNKPKNLPKKRF